MVAISQAWCNVGLTQLDLCIREREDSPYSVGPFLGLGMGPVTDQTVCTETPDNFDGVIPELTVCCCLYSI